MVGPDRTEAGQQADRAVRARRSAPFGLGTGSCQSHQDAREWPDRALAPDAALASRRSGGGVEMRDRYGQDVGRLGEGDDVVAWYLLEPARQRLGLLTGQVEPGVI